MDQKDKPIFYNPNQTRWLRIKYSFYIICSLFILISILFITSLLIRTYLINIPAPSLGNFSFVKHLQPSSKILSNQTNKTIQEVQTGLNILYPRHNEGFSRVPLKDEHPKIMAFLSDDNASIGLLKENLNKIDILVGEWLVMNPTDGKIVDSSSENLENTVSYIREHKPNTDILPNVAFMSKNDNDVGLSQDIRKKIIGSLDYYVQSYHLNGIVLTFEYEKFNKTNTENLYSFIDELTKIFHEHNAKVYINIDAYAAPIDYKKISESVDYVILNAFEEHHVITKAGPIASIKWYNDLLNEYETSIPSKKIIFAFSNYGYDWDENQKVQIRSFTDVMQLAKITSAKIFFDPQSFNPTYDYRRENVLHHVWFLDAVTMVNQMILSHRYKPYAYAVWKLGSEDPSIWNVIDKTYFLNNGIIDQLKNIDTTLYLNSLGYSGQIIRIDRDLEIGERSLTVNKLSGLIEDENYQKIPTSYLVHYYKLLNDDKKIALTFDDGPNPIDTPKVLEILKKFNIPATFFVIGRNALFYPDLIKREFKEGHEIGNHTFNHPDLSKIYESLVSLEVNSNERLLTTLIGKKTNIFRPPYGVDGSPETKAEADPIVIVSKLGYLTVGGNVDPKDWQQPGVNKIVTRTLNAIKEGQSNIIIMHDGGGTSRQQTVDALPVIISELLQKGYQFVTISQLLNLKTDTILQTAHHAWEGFIDNLGFSYLRMVFNLFKFLFIFSIVVTVIRFLIVIVLGIIQKIREKSSTLQPSNDYSVTVIIPAYNESKVIEKTVNRLLKVKHPKRFDIILVNDGSSDNTLQVMTENFKDNPIIKILDQANSGKSKALNNAIALTNSDIIIILDADTVSTSNTIMALLEKFDDKEVGAVAGTVSVGNKINILTKWQALEYTTNQNLDRRAFKVLNAIPVVPGAIGAWRREIIIEAGGFTSDTVNEDSDLTFKILRLGYKIEFAEDALVFTEAPDNIAGLIRQRYRWIFGNYQVFWKHRKLFFNPNYFSLGFIALPNILLQIILQLLSPILDLVFIFAVFNLAIDWWYHPLQDFNNNLVVILIYYALFQLFDVMVSLIAFILDNREPKSLLIWLFPQRFFYRQLMYYIVYKTLIAVLQGRAVWWGRPVRKSTVVI